MKKSERRAKIFELYSDGKSIDEICLILGYHRAEYVRSVLREGGIPLVDKDIPGTSTGTESCGRNTT